MPSGATSGAVKLSVMLVASEASMVGAGMDVEV